ncbi:MAG: tetratricopeptide repeat protein [Nitrososphaeria archaeon]
MKCEDLYKVAEACICLTFYEEAAILYKKYIEECNAKDPAAWHGLANALEEIKDEAYKEAYKKAYELYDESSWSSCLWKGWCAMKLGKYEEAVRLFEKSFKYNDKYPYTLQSLGLALIKLGRKDDADEVLRRFKEISKEIKYEDRICEGYAMLLSVKNFEEINHIYRKAQAVAERCNKNTLGYAR